MTDNNYTCTQLHTVRPMGIKKKAACIPLIVLPVSLIGKTVKVTVEVVE